MLSIPLSVGQNVGLQFWCMYVSECSVHSTASRSVATKQCRIDVHFDWLTAAKHSRSRALSQHFVFGFLAAVFRHSKDTLDFQMRCCQSELRYIPIEESRLSSQFVMNHRCSLLNVLFSFFFVRK